MDNLSSHIQSVRKLKPFLEAIEALVSLSESAQRCQSAVSGTETRLSKLQGEIDQAEKDKAQVMADSDALAASASSAVKNAEIRALEIVAAAEKKAGEIKAGLLADYAMKKARLDDELQMLADKGQACRAEIASLREESAVLSEKVAKAKEYLVSLNNFAR